MSRGLNTKDDEPRAESRVEVPAYNQTAEENSSSSEYFTCVSSPSRLPRGDEEFYNPEYAPQPESRVEVPAYNQTAGENSSSSEYFTCASATSRLPRVDEVFHQLHRNVSSIGTLKKLVSQSTRKQKRLEGHPGEFYNPDYAPQPESRVEVPAYNQTAGENSSSSEYFSCDSSQSKLPHGNEEFYNPEHAPQPESRVEVPAYNQTAGENSTSSEYFTCFSSQSRLPHGNEVFHQLHPNVSPFGTLKKPVSQSTRKRKRMEGHPGEFYNPEHAPQPESRVEVPAYNQTAGENSSSSEYFTCISSTSRLPHGDEVFHQLHPNVSPFGTLKKPVSQSTRKRKRMEGHPGEMNRMPLPQDLEQSKISSSSSPTSSPFYSFNDNIPFMSSALGEDERVMTIYYMHVQMKGGVAVLYNTEGGFKPPSKKIKMQKMTYIEKVHENIPCSHPSVKKFTTDHEPSLNSRAQEKWNTYSPYSRAQPPTLVEYSRVSRPEWLLAGKSGFRCMACCRVFPSLEVLQEHVENGVNEGFSCHTFHLTLARLKCKEPKEENEETERATFRRQMATYFGLKTISYKLTNYFSAPKR